MKKQDVWNEEINPDFISDPLDNLNTDVWDRGYYKETDDGIWYEVYVNDQIKKAYPKMTGSAQFRDLEGSNADNFSSNLVNFTKQAEKLRLVEAGISAAGLENIKTKKTIKNTYQAVGAQGFGGAPARDGA